MAPLSRYEGGRVLPCADRTVIDDGCVVVEGERLAWVGPTADLPPRYVGGDATVVDVTGATVLPGLVDAHCHLSFGEARSEEELSLHAPLTYRAVRAAVDAERVLLAGVTSACDPGGPPGVAMAARDAIDAGLVQGPRLATAGQQLSSQQGIGDTLPAWLGPVPTAFGRLVRSAEDLVQAIRDEVKAGVDLIKIAGSGPGTEEHGAFHPDELRRAVEEAHRLGRPITVHARSRSAVADAVDAGFDWIMHASFMDEATLEQVVARRVPLVPALTLLANSLDARRGPIPDGDPIRRELDAAVAVLSRARAAGAVLVAGSESGFAMTPYGEWHTRELELFVELLGMDHHDALLAMTRDAAAILPRIGGEVGVLEAGRYADLLVVDGRPDQDVHLLAQPERRRMVVKGGMPVTPWRPPDAPRRRHRFEDTRTYVAAVHHRPRPDREDRP